MILFGINFRGAMIMADLVEKVERGRWGELVMMGLASFILDLFIRFIISKTY